MYNNRLKHDRQGRCNRVINLYCNSIDYHIALLKSENTTFDEFRLDIIGLVGSLKRYVEQNKRYLNKHLLNYISGFNIDLNLDKITLLKHIENFKKSICFI